MDPAAGALAQRPPPPHRGAFPDRAPGQPAKRRERQPQRAAFTAVKKQLGLPAGRTVAAGGELGRAGAWSEDPGPRPDRPRQARRPTLSQQNHSLVLRGRHVGIAHVGVAVAEPAVQLGPQRRLDLLRAQVLFGLGERHCHRGPARMLPQLAGGASAPVTHDV